MKLLKHFLVLVSLFNLALPLQALPSKECLSRVRADLTVPFLYLSGALTGTFVLHAYNDATTQKEEHLVQDIRKWSRGYEQRFEYIQEHIEDGANPCLVVTEDGRSAVDVAREMVRQEKLPIEIAEYLEESCQE